MVHSTWGDWLVREIESTEPDGMSVWYLGCNAFVVRTPGVTVYVDPYFGDGDPPNLIRMIPVPVDPADATLADAVLVSHEHIDHMHPPSYRGLLEAGATVHAPSAAWESPDYGGDLLAEGDARAVVTEGDELAVGDLTVHVRGANDPDAIEPVSYVFEHDGTTFFHPGDSRPAPEAFPAIADEFDLDCGALAFGSVGNVYFPEDDETRVTRWYMDENQVVEAAGQLELDRLLPSHWDMWRGVGADPKALHEHAHTFEYPRTIDVVKIGDRVDVGERGVAPATGE
jgi:L-ascorbate 6-phosphate lactonase